MCIPEVSSLSGLCFNDGMKSKNRNTGSFELPESDCRPRLRQIIVKIPKTIRYNLPKVHCSLLTNVFICSLVTIHSPVSVWIGADLRGA
jgi:hypothetical protein